MNDDNGVEPGKLSEKRGRARSVPFFAPSLCLEWLEARFLPQYFGFVDFFPGKLWFAPAEMAIGGGLSENLTAELEMFYDAPWCHREVLAHEFIEIVHGHLLRIFRIDEDGNRISHTDRISQLHFALVGQPGRDDVFCDVARHVRCRAVDLCGVLARERAAAMAAVSAVRVDDDLAAGEAGIAHRPADDEPSGRIDMVLDAGRIIAAIRHDRLDDLFHDASFDLLGRDVRTVL